MEAIHDIGGGAREVISYLDGSFGPDISRRYEGLHRARAHLKSSGLIISS